MSAANSTTTDSFTIYWDVEMGTYRVSIPNLSPNGERVEVVPAVVHEQYRDALDELAECAEWYRRCLEDVQDRRPVGGLTEAKLGYDHAYRKARALLDYDAFPRQRLSTEEDGQ